MTLGAVVAAFCWVLYVLLLHSPTNSRAAGAVHVPVTPGLLGVVGKLSPTGSSSNVDTRDSTGPLILLIGSPGTRAADWAAVQALLERSGVGSVVIVPRDGAWQGTIRITADSLLDHWGPRRRPMATVTFGTALDSLLAAAPVGHALRGQRLATVAPGRPRVTGLQRILTRLSAILRPVPIRGDLRLAAWAAPVMVLRAQDDDRFDGKDAQRLADGAGQSRVEVLPGGGFSSAPQHPADDTWRELIEFVLGRTRYHDVVVQPDSVMVRDTSLELPATVPSRVTPSLQRPR